MFYIIHILTDSRKIENKNAQEYKILTEEQKQLFADSEMTVKEHIIAIKCGQPIVDVYCPEISAQEDTSGERYLIVPEFAVPGRPYPIYVYIYAVATYCLNPNMGQREAAQETREKFGLKTFSHTTLGRAMKKIEKLTAQDSIETQSKETQNGTTAGGSKKFPTTAQTKDRRDKVAAYLIEASDGGNAVKEETFQPGKRPGYTRPPYEGAFIDACHGIVRNTFLKYHCLLL